ncbi:MAG: hypothetical protein B6I20_00135 [Bacteroidetes bacterium 4572_117]|nr:MAG: hypothetical protein B6I20_00135 [Bacteroidetes bacterium 4572_117]
MNHGNFFKATSINYFFARNKYNEQYASLPCYEILQGHKYFLIAELFENILTMSDCLVDLFP